MDDIKHKYVGVDLGIKDYSCHYILTRARVFPQIVLWVQGIIIGILIGLAIG